MRVLLFVLTLVASTWAAASQLVAGTIIRTGNDTFLQSDDACGKYRIVSQGNDTQETLQKLVVGDSVTATGSFDKDKCIAAIETIDYVGLKRLLGNWMSREGLLSVHDFTTMSFYPVAGASIKSFGPAPIFSIIKPVMYKYSLTPSDGKEWVLFLSDNETTTFATIQFGKEVAIMKLYDSDNGNVNKVIFLTRRGVLK